MALIQRQVAHIWRRLGFGPAPDQVEAGVSVGTSALIADLCSRPATTASTWNWPDTGHWTDDPLFYTRNLELMAFGPNPLHERSSWILMGLLVIARNDFIHLPGLKVYANSLRTHALGSYHTLLEEITRSAAMQWYLNGFDSTREHPNENLARELLELFALGVVDPLTGTPNYGEPDVKEIARALTGFSYDWNQNLAIFVNANWDNGPKSFLGAPRGNAGVTEVMAAIAQQASYRRYIAHRYYVQLVGSAPSASTLADLATVFGAQGDLRALLSSIAQRPEFIAESNHRNRVKCPLELVVAAVRLLGLGNLYGDRGFYLNSEMERLQQVLFRAPNVNGWPQGRSWLHPGTLIGWSEQARSFCFRDTGIDGDGSGGTTAPENRCPTIRRLHQDGVSLSAGARAELCLRLAGLYDASLPSYNALSSYAAAGSWNHSRACALMHLALLTPDFLVN